MDLDDERNLCSFHDGFLVTKIVDRVRKSTTRPKDPFCSHVLCIDGNRLRFCSMVGYDEMIFFKQSAKDREKMRSSEPNRTDVHTALHDDGAVR